MLTIAKAKDNDKDKHKQKANDPYKASAHEPETKRDCKATPSNLPTQAHYSFETALTLSRKRSTFEGKHILHRSQMIAQEK